MTQDVSENMLLPSISLAYLPFGRPSCTCFSQAAYCSQVMSSVGAGAPVALTMSTL